MFSSALACALRVARCRVECVAGVAVMALRVQRARDMRSGVAVCVSARFLIFCAAQCSLTHHLQNVIGHRGAVKF